MEIILLILLGVAGYALFKWRMAKRGMRFVRAFAFLDHMDCGASVDEANGFVLRIVRRRMIWNGWPDFGAESLGSLGLGYAA